MKPEQPRTPPPGYPPYGWQGAYASPRPLGEIVDIGEIIDNMVALRWRIVGLSLALAITGFLIAFFLPPIYTAETLVRIEPEITTAGEQTSIEVEREVITSRALLNDVISKMGRSVDLSYGGSYVPARIGSLWLSPEKSPGNVIGATTPYIGIRTLLLPRQYEGKPLSIVAGNEGRYHIFAPDGTKLIDGKVGILFESNAQDAENAVRVLVDAIHAPSGTAFEVVPRSTQDFTEQLIGKLQAARRGYRGMSGLLALEFSSTDPVFAQAFLQEVVDTYVTQAFDRSSIGKVRSLEYLEKQLRSLQDQIDATEENLALFRNEEGVMDVSTESRLLLEEIADADRQVADLNVQYNKLSSTHGDNHPAIRSIFQQKHYLERRRSELEQRVSRMPELERSMITLTRKLKNLQRLYEVNLEEHNALKTAVEGISGYARVVSEPALIKQPNWQRTGLFVLGGAMAGSLSSIIWIFLNSLPAFIRVWRTEQLQHHASFPLIGLLPRVMSLRGSPGFAADHIPSGARMRRVIAFLEKNWRFLFYGTSSQVVVVSSLLPGQGKTTFSSHLAQASGKQVKTLLIHAGITQRTLRLPFSSKRAPGLSDALVGDCTPEDVILTQSGLSFDFIPPGTRTANARLLADTKRIKDLLDHYSKTYARIIVDYPTLAPSDTAGGLEVFGGALVLVVRQGSPLIRLKQFYRNHPEGMTMPAYILLNDYQPEWFAIEQLMRYAKKLSQPAPESTPVTG